MSLLARFNHAGTGVGVLDDGQQVFDQRVGVARVPLQDALQARMLEIGQRQINAGAQLAQPDHDVMAQVPDMPQRLPVDKFQQAHVHRLPIDIDG